MSSIDRLDSIMSELPPDLQQEVIDYAQYLLNTKDDDPDSADGPRFYICPVCFAAASQPLQCHDRPMIPCNTKNPEDCKPLMDEEGNFNSRAPRWFIALTRNLQAE
jgi:hypothetical protein